MIRSFADAETAIVWDGRRSRKLPPDIQATALRKLMMLNRSRVLSDLRIPPANRLESFKGKRGTVEHSDQPAVAYLFCVE